MRAILAFLLKTFGYSGTLIGAEMHYDRAVQLFTGASK